ncbi:pyruvate kinase [Candidatus Laterigemmans baculatus]|uniref:pyruvate kinase n=1 Tax=Candidatus Laterigemmans baculatus TaxID=2770505 RepID=UPI0013D8F513|nr:pyruvate kinase [Candidatus Laterigemmans baculatus]
MSRPTLCEACTKIVATVGPACDTVERLVTLIEHGVDIFRINSAHGDREQHSRTLANIRAASAQVGYSVGVLLDLAGPKLRLGKLLEEPLQCELGMELTFVRGDKPGSPTELTSSYPRLIDELKPGNHVMLADGTVALRVEEVHANRARCRVIGGGEIRSRQGINLPGVALSVSSMRPRDVDNAIWGAKEGVDLISLSFVRTAEDVRSLKNLLTSYESTALVIAKIEKREALEHLESIVDASDGVMVARGDLGVEIDVAETPVAQKRIIRICRDKLKPVIVATQMLESMHHNKRPTRAEASDVANAILDGADACMLSGETAIGEFPVEAVDTMHRIMIHTEQEMLTAISDPRQNGSNRVHPITSAVAYGATTIAESIGAKLIVIATRSGGTAWVKSKQRSLIPTLGASDNEETLRRMTLFWGIKPCRVSQLDDAEVLFDEISRWGCQNGMLAPGDRIVFVTGNSVMHHAHNLLVVHSVTAESCRIGAVATSPTPSSPEPSPPAPNPSTPKPVREPATPE